MSPSVSTTAMSKKGTKSTATNKKTKKNLRMAHDLGLLDVQPSAKRIRGNNNGEKKDTVESSISPTTVTTMDIGDVLGSLAAGDSSVLGTETAAKKDGEEAKKPTNVAAEAKAPEGATKMDKDMEQVVLELYRLFHTTDPKILISHLSFLKENADHIKNRMPVFLEQHGRLHLALEEKVKACKELEGHLRHERAVNANLRLQTLNLQRQVAHNKELAANFAEWIRIFCYNVTQHSVGLTNHLTTEFHRWVVNGIVASLTSFGREHAAILNGEERHPIHHNHPCVGMTTGDRTGQPSIAQRPVVLNNTNSLMMVGGAAAPQHAPSSDEAGHGGGFVAAGVFRPAGHQVGNPMDNASTMKNYNKPRSSGAS